VYDINLSILADRHYLFIITKNFIGQKLGVDGSIFLGYTILLLEPVSKIGFWFKIEAEPSFPAKLDSPSDLILFVGRKPEAYCGMSRILNEAPTKILGQKTFLR
jgi:hypothetical protein